MGSGYAFAAMRMAAFLCQSFGTATETSVIAKKRTVL